MSDRATRSRDSSRTPPPVGRRGGRARTITSSDEIENSEEDREALRARAKAGAPKGPPPPRPVNTILGPPPRGNRGRVGGAAREETSEPEGGAAPPKASTPKAKVSTVTHPGTISRAHR